MIIKSLIYDHVRCRNLGQLKLIMKLVGLIWNPDAACWVLTLYFLIFVESPMQANVNFSNGSKELSNKWTKNISIF